MRFLQIFGRKLTSDGVDAIIGPVAGYAGALLVLALGFRKLALLPLTETELFFGILLVLAVVLLCVNLAMLTGMQLNGRKQRSD